MRKTGLISPPGLKLLETVECERRKGETALAACKRVLLTEALWAEHGNVAAASERLGINSVVYHNPGNRPILAAARAHFGPAKTGRYAGKQVIFAVKSEVAR